MSDPTASVISARLGGPGLSVVSGKIEAPPVSVVSAAVGGPPGVPGRDGAGAALIEGENRDTVTIQVGMAVARHPSGVGFIAADRRYIARQACGLAVEATAPGFSVTVALEGILEQTSWILATGASSLPSSGLIYLGESGGLSDLPPTTPGEYLQILGVPVSARILSVGINQQIIVMR